MKAPVNGFALPAGAPKPVDRAQTKLANVAAQLQELDEKIGQAERDVTKARQLDAERVRDQALAGKLSDDPTKAERKALADLQAVKAGRRGVEMAVAQASGEMIDSIQANLEPWANALRDRLHAAHEAYLAAVDAATHAAGELRAARAGLAFLEQSALHPEREPDNPRDRREFQQYTGSASLAIDARLDANRQPEATDLLRAARQLTAEPPAPPVPRKLEVAAAHRGDGSYRLGDPRPTAA